MRHAGEPSVGVPGVCAIPGEEVAPPPVCRGPCRLKPAVQTPCAMQPLGVAGAALSQHLAALARAVQFVFANRKLKTAMRTVTSRPNGVARASGSGVSSWVLPWGRAEDRSAGS